MRTIFAITPSWLIKNRQDYNRGLVKLQKLGFDVRNSKILTKLPSPKQKAAEIKEGFVNPEIDILLAQRGGYSSLKILPYVDFGAIKKNPKLFAGFSDISTLLNSIYEQTGLVTLHAPMVLNFCKPSKFTVDSFLNAINGFPQRDLLKDSPIKVYHEGSATGILKGGNLVTQTSLIGTKWDMVTKGSIIFLEDVDEEMHRVDRYLSHWLLAGKFKDVNGIVLGDFRGLKSDDVYGVLSSQMKITFPVIHCPNIGHVKNKITLPVGAKVRLDTRTKTLVIK